MPSVARPITRGHWPLPSATGACDRSSRIATSGSGRSIRQTAQWPAARSGAPHQRGDDVRRDGHAVLVGESGGGDEDVKDVGEALTREQPAFRLAAAPLRRSRDRGASLHDERSLEALTGADSPSAVRGTGRSRCRSNAVRLGVLARPDGRDQVTGLTFGRARPTKRLAASVAARDAWSVGLRRSDPYRGSLSPPPLAPAAQARKQDKVGDLRRVAGLECHRAHGPVHRQARRPDRGHAVLL